VQNVLNVFKFTLYLIINLIIYFIFKQIFRADLLKLASAKLFFIDFIDFIDYFS
jgi:hypothetical protein